MKRKLRSRSGETILEVLIACLIGFFAVLMLSEMIAASSKLIVHGREDMDSYRKSAINFVNKEEKPEKPFSDGTVTFSYNWMDTTPAKAKPEECSYYPSGISGASSDGNLAVKFAASDDSGERRVVSYWR